jgi:hypothetical protein
MLWESFDSLVGGFNESVGCVTTGSAAAIALGLAAFAIGTDWNGSLRIPVCANILLYKSTCVLFDILPEGKSGFSKCPLLNILLSIWHMVPLLLKDIHKVMNLSPNWKNKLKCEPILSLMSSPNWWFCNVLCCHILNCRIDWGPLRSQDVQNFFSKLPWICHILVKEYQGTALFQKASLKHKEVLMLGWDHGSWQSMSW